MNFTPFNYYHICLVIQSIPWCLSVKKKRGRLEYYKQYSKDGVRHQDYIRTADIPKMLDLYSRKKRCLKVKREMDQIIKSMEKPLRHEVMCQLKFFKEIDADEGQISHLLDLKNNTQFYAEHQRNLNNTPITLDGTVLDSKAEILCYNIASKAGLRPQHNTKIFTDFEVSSFYRTVDLSFWTFYDRYGIPIRNRNKACSRRQIYLEHFGMLEKSDYRQNQLTKLEEYRRNGIACGDNLIITAPHNGTSEQSILVQYVVGRLVSGIDALRMFRAAKKQKNNTL